MVLQTPHAARYQPVIFSDAGSNLYPLCELPTERLPKAVLPVMNRPMIAYPLQWLVSAGFRSCLVIAPEAEHSVLASALRSLYLVPVGQKSDSAAGADATLSGNVSEGNVLVTIGGTGARPAGTAPGSAEDDPVAGERAQEEPVMHIEILPAGPVDETPVRSIMHPTTTLTRNRWGTAQLLYWLAATRQLEVDPLVVPVDLIMPNFPLASFLATNLAAVPEPPCVSCLFYERGAGEGTGKERERDGPANLYTVYDRRPLRTQDGVTMLPNGAHEHVQVYKPLLIMDSDDVSDRNSTDLELRMSLLWRHNYARVSTALLDSRVYVLRLDQVLPLLEMHPELNDITDQLVPFIVKCGWQHRLSSKAGWHGAAKPAPEGPERGRSISSPSMSMSIAELPPPQHFMPHCEAVIVRLKSEPPRPLPPGVTPEGERNKSPQQEIFAARANTVPTYLECNRHMLRMTASQTLPANYAIPGTVGCGAVPTAPATAEGGPIHPRAQISADSLVGTGTTIDERATVKQSILGRGCSIAKGARIMRCVIMDNVTIGESSKLENCIVGSNAQIGERAQLKESDIGPHYVVERGTESKNEKLVYTPDEDD
ncbi:Translation initiation factor eIF-2B subunit gamma [Malassezia cuniculi]|uniref:Translation initiation factor eIF2B subunit gamma n=1 Tax=Malassezia cuniculi TaxID=948313 RepID=A0AAF0EW86_9BASI|nr:Translation initiation factor eIF-2B subunit gamma [Malassezia cuniculi]